jgi:hypothetical protein
MFISRNSRKPMRVLRLAILGAVQGGALLAGTTAAQAADHPDKFVMTAFTNAAGGENILNGNYQAAIEQTRYAESTDTPTASNQCVAYTMSGQFAAAQSACDTAVSSAREDLRKLAPAQLWDEQRRAQNLAIAYSNRAVLDWLSHDNAAAHRDLSKAGSAAPGTAVVSQNMTALNSPNHENTVAQVTPLRGQ